MSDIQKDVIKAVIKEMEMTEQNQVFALNEWHLGSMNDGLFIIDTPPRPSTDEVYHDHKDGPTMVLNVTELPHEKAQAIVDAHNRALSYRLTVEKVS